jgi:hypothetical protein
MNHYYLDYWLKGVEDGTWTIRADNFDNAVKAAKEQLDKYSNGVPYEINGIYLKGKWEE